MKCRPARTFSLPSVRCFSASRNLSSFVVALLLFLVSCGEPEVAVSVRKTEIDLTNVAQYREVHGDFEIENRGYGNLVLSSFQGSCSCGSDYPKEIAIGPGGKRTLPVRSNTGNREGALKKTLLMKTNDPARPQVALTLSMTVVRGVAFYPKVVDFGRLDPVLRDTGRRRLHVLAPNGQFRILSAEPTNKELRVESIDLVESPRRVFMITLSMDEAASGPVMQCLLRIHTNDPVYPLLNVPVLRRCRKNDVVVAATSPHFSQPLE